MTEQESASHRAAMTFAGLAVISTVASLCLAAFYPQQAFIAVCLAFHFRTWATSINDRLNR